VANAYAELEHITFEGAHFRTDIGLRQGQVLRQRRQPTERRPRRMHS